MVCHPEGTSVPEGPAFVSSLKGLCFVFIAYRGLTSWATIVPSFGLAPCRSPSGHDFGRAEPRTPGYCCAAPAALLSGGALDRTGSPRSTIRFIAWLIGM